MAKKAKKAKEKKPKGKPGKLGLKGRLFLIIGVLIALVFLPTSMLLFFGMLPSIIAFFASGRGIGARASTITAMNMAGCIPFVFKLWSTGNDFEASVQIVTNIRYMSIIYLSAAFGYMIDWVMTGIVSSFLYQKGLNRMKAIKKRQEALIEQWGEGVSGKTPQDEDLLDIED